MDGHASTIHLDPPPLTVHVARSTQRTDGCTGRSGQPEWFPESLMPHRNHSQRLARNDHQRYSCQVGGRPGGDGRGRAGAGAAGDGRGWTQRTHGAGGGIGSGLPCPPAGGGRCILGCFPTGAGGRQPQGRARTRRRRRAAAGPPPGRDPPPRTRRQKYHPEQRPALPGSRSSARRPLQGLPSMRDA